MAFADSAAALIANQTALLASLQALPSEIQAALAGAGSIALWVDPVLGNDANVGTQAAPLKTITKGVLLAPEGRQTTIYLPASSTAVCHLAPADTGSVSGSVDITARNIVITPWQGAFGDAAETPTVVFDTISSGGQNISFKFTGTGSLIWSGVNILYPTPIDLTAGTAQCYGVNIGWGAVTTVSHFFCEITLGAAPAVITSGGVLLLQVGGCTINPAAGITAASVRLVDFTVVPSAIIEMGANTLPSGLNLGSLFELPSGAPIASGAPTPAGILSNNTSW
jgi:hypothetical protein